MVTKNPHNIIILGAGSTGTYLAEALCEQNNLILVDKDVNKINLDGTKSVIDACLHNNVRRLIFPSTTSVYGPISGIALEDSSRSDLQPQSPYAVSKLAAEDQVLIATQQSVIDGVVLRLGTIFGPSIGMRFHTAVNKFIYHSVIGRPLTAVSYTHLTLPTILLV